MLWELLTWVQQLKNLVLAGQNQLQSESITVNTLIGVFYFIIVLCNNEASRVYSLLVFLFCLLIAYTQIYQQLDEVQYHSIFAIIYLLLTYRVKPIKAKVASCMLGAFQTLMAWDSYANAEIETFIWLHYEIIVCVLHALIIGSFIERDVNRIKSNLEAFASIVRHFFGYSCNRLCLWYY